eukprot:4734129-Pyramimonas_sp.AAC.1
MPLRCPSAALRRPTPSRRGLFAGRLRAAALRAAVPCVSRPATGALGAGAGAAKLRGAGASDGLHLVSPCGGLDK